MTRPNHLDGPLSKRGSSGKKISKRENDNPFARRVLSKALSRAQDEADMSSGRITKEQMQEINSPGLKGLLRNARIGRRGESDGDND